MTQVRESAAAGPERKWEPEELVAKGPEMRKCEPGALEANRPESTKGEVTEANT